MCEHKSASSAHTWIQKPAMTEDPALVLFCLLLVNNVPRKRTRYNLYTSYLHEIPFISGPSGGPNNVARRLH